MKKLSRDCYIQNLHHFVPEIDFIVKHGLKNKKIVKAYLKIIK